MPNAGKVTWVDNVSKFFTHYDAIQMRFRLDLSDYQSVKSHAAAIAMAVSQGHPNTSSRMPMNEPAWSDQQVAAFQRWIAEGFWYSQTAQAPPSPPPPDPALNGFIQLASALTGFDLSQPMDQLHPPDRIAAYYLRRIRNWSGGGPLDALIAAYEQEPSALPQLAAGETFGALCRQIILLWYTAAIVTVSGAGGAPVGSFDFGTPDDNQYPTGLVWRAAQAHPMGYSIEQFGYWANRPQDTAWTGLGQSSGV